MENTIYREDAIALVNKPVCPTGNSDYDDGRETEREAIKESLIALPPADRPQGKWIRINSLYSIDRTYRCSVCAKVIYDMPMDEYYDPAYKGCPYCLTRMKGADDE